MPYINSSTIIMKDPKLLSLFCNSIADFPRCVVLEVEDTGRDIPQDEQTKIFRRSYRASNVADIQGTGIGLDVTQTIVSSMGFLTVKKCIDKFTQTWHIICIKEYSFAVPEVLRELTPVEIPLAAERRFSRSTSHVSKKQEADTKYSVWNIWVSSVERVISMLNPSLAKGRRLLQVYLLLPGKKEET